MFQLPEMSNIQNPLCICSRCQPDQSPLVKGLICAGASMSYMTTETIFTGNRFSQMRPKSPPGRSGPFFVLIDTKPSQQSGLAVEVTSLARAGAVPSIDHAYQSQLSTTTLGYLGHSLAHSSPFGVDTQVNLKPALAHQFSVDISHILHMDICSQEPDNRRCTTRPYYFLLNSWCRE
jgi:hypothetical protein